MTTMVSAPVTASSQEPEQLSIDADLSQCVSPPPVSQPPLAATPAPSTTMTCSQLMRSTAAAGLLPPSAQQYLLAHQRRKEEHERALLSQAQTPVHASASKTHLTLSPHTANVQPPMRFPCRGMLGQPGLSSGAVPPRYTPILLALSHYRHNLKRRADGSLPVVYAPWGDDADNIADAAEHCNCRYIPSGYDTAHEAVAQIRYRDRDVPADHEFDLIMGFCFGSEASRYLELCYAMQRQREHLRSTQPPTGRNAPLKFILFLCSETLCGLRGSLAMASSMMAQAEEALNKLAFFRGPVYHDGKRQLAVLTNMGSSPISFVTVPCTKNPIAYASVAYLWRTDAARMPHFRATETELLRAEAERPGSLGPAVPALPDRPRRVHATPESLSEVVPWPLMLSAISVLYNLAHDAGKRLTTVVEVCPHPESSFLPTLLAALGVAHVQLHWSRGQMLSLPPPTGDKDMTLVVLHARDATCIDVVERLLPLCHAARAVVVELTCTDFFARAWHVCPPTSFMIPRRTLPHTHARGVLVWDAHEFMGPKQHQWIACRACHEEPTAAQLQEGLRPDPTTGCVNVGKFFDAHQDSLQPLHHWADVTIEDREEAIVARAPHVIDAAFDSEQSRKQLQRALQAGPPLASMNTLTAAAKRGVRKVLKFAAAVNREEKEKEKETTNATKRPRKC